MALLVECYKSYNNWCRTQDTKLTQNRIGTPPGTTEGVINSAVTSLAMNLFLHRGNFILGAQGALIGAAGKLTFLVMGNLFHAVLGLRNHKHSHLVYNAAGVLLTPLFGKVSRSPVAMKETYGVSFLTLGAFAILQPTRLPMLLIVAIMKKA